MTTAISKQFCDMCPFAKQYSDRLTGLKLNKIGGVCLMSDNEA